MWDLNKPWLIKFCHTTAIDNFYVNVNRILEIAFIMVQSLIPEVYLVFKNDFQKNIYAWRNSDLTRFLAVRLCTADTTFTQIYQPQRKTNSFQAYFFGNLRVWVIRLSILQNPSSFLWEKSNGLNLLLKLAIVHYSCYIKI